MGERCRSVQVEVDGEPVPVVVRGGEDLDEQGRMALADVVAAALRRQEAEDQADPDRVRRYEEARHRNHERNLRLRR